MGKQVITNGACCPTCGKLIDAPLRMQVSLDENVFIYGEHVIRLKPKEAEVLFLLVEKYPLVVRRTDMMVKAWPLTQAVGPKLPDVYISLLRKKIGHLGLEIVNSYQHGWALKRIDQGKQAA